MSTAVQSQPNLPASAFSPEPRTPPSIIPDSPTSDSTASPLPNSSTKPPTVTQTANGTTVPISNGKVVKIIVVSDMMCPWCYVAFKSINLALSRLALSQISQSPTGPVTQFELEYRPFPLITTFGSDDVAVEKQAFGEKRFGKERMAEMHAVIRERGKELGIDFKFGGLMRQTTRSHRLLTLAYTRGGSTLQQSLLAHLFRAYFEEEKDIGSPAILAYYADLVGLMKRDEAEEWIKGNEGEEEVKRLVAVSQGCGIRGVPFVVVDGRWAISGCQAEGEYYKVLERLVKGQMGEAGSVPSATEDVCT